MTTEKATEMSEQDQEGLLEWLEVVFSKLEEAESPVSDPGSGVLYLNALKPFARVKPSTATVATIAFQ